MVKKNIAIAIIIIILFIVLAITAWIIYAYKNRISIFSKRRAVDEESGEEGWWLITCPGWLFFFTWGLTAYCILRSIYLSIYTIRLSMAVIDWIHYEWRIGMIWSYYMNDAMRCDAADWFIMLNEGMNEWMGMGLLCLLVYTSRYSVNIDRWSGCDGGNYLGFILLVLLMSDRFCIHFLRLYFSTWISIGLLGVPCIDANFMMNRFTVSFLNAKLRVGDLKACTRIWPNSLTSQEAGYWIIVFQTLR